MELKLFTTFIVVAAILASPKHKAFTWSYRSSIYRVHWIHHRLYAFYRLYASLSSNYIESLASPSCVKSVEIGFGAT